LLFHYVIVQNILVASKTKKREEKRKKIVQKDVYWILPQKTKQEKKWIKSTQNEFKFDTIITGILIASHIKFGVNWISFAWGFKFRFNQV